MFGSPVIVPAVGKQLFSRPTQENYLFDRRLGGVSFAWTLITMNLEARVEWRKQTKSDIISSSLFIVFSCRPRSEVRQGQFYSHYKQRKKSRVKLRCFCCWFFRFGVSTSTKIFHFHDVVMLRRSLSFSYYVMMDGRQLICLEDNLSSLLILSSKFA